MLPFIALSSSRGTTFQAILDRIANGSLHAKCLGLITDRPDRECIQKAQAAEIPVIILVKISGETREEYDQRIDESIDQLLSANPNVNREQLIIAALGWLWILTPQFIARWKNRIINVHPALLPRHGGEGMYGQHVHRSVLSSGDTESGITIHLVDIGVDTGRILLQKQCAVLPDDTHDSLKVRVQELEKQWYPEVLAMIERGEISL